MGCDGRRWFCSRRAEIGGVEFGCEALQGLLGLPRPSESLFLALPETSTLEMEVEGHCFLLQFRGGFW